MINDSNNYVDGLINVPVYVLVDVPAYGLEPVLTSFVGGDVVSAQDMFCLRNAKERDC